MSLTAIQIEAQRNASGLDGAIYSWETLSDIPTANRPLVSLPIVKIWIDRETGLVRAMRLLPSTEETDLAAGIQRPRDFNLATNQKVWFVAG